MAKYVNLVVKPFAEALIGKRPTAEDDSPCKVIVSDGSAKWIATSVAPIASPIVLYQYDICSYFTSSKASSWDGSGSFACTSTLSADSWVTSTTFVEILTATVSRSNDNTTITMSFSSEVTIQSIGMNFGAIIYTAYNKSDLANCKGIRIAYINFDSPITVPAGSNLVVTIDGSTAEVTVEE